MIRIPPSELKFTFSKSSGKGGQNVNKVNTKVLLEWNFGESKRLTIGIRTRLLENYKRRIKQGEILYLTSQRFRNQARNIADCIDKLNTILESVRLAPKKRKPTRPTKASVEKRIKQKKIQSDRKKERGKVSDYRVI